MRIERLEPDFYLYRGYCNDLARLFDSRECTDRPCSSCDLACADYKSPTCSCACAPDCQHAPKRMSSDGDQFPVEAKVAPLVYAFLRLRECQPCWSCEGHESRPGAPMRLPRVIFYARSTVYPALIAEAVAKLYFQKKISNRWEVVITPVGNMLDATYTLQPNVALGEVVGLDHLQVDARIIAESLCDGVLGAAKMYQAELSAALVAPDIA